MFAIVLVIGLVFAVYLALWAAAAAIHVPKDQDMDVQFKHALRLLFTWPFVLLADGKRWLRKNK